MGSGCFIPTSLRPTAVLASRASGARRNGPRGRVVPCYLKALPRGRGCQGRRPRLTPANKNSCEAGSQELKFGRMANSAR
jgi:hypothetical protein